MNNCSSGDNINMKKSVSNQEDSIGQIFSKNFVNNESQKYISEIDCNNPKINRSSDSKHKKPVNSSANLKFTIVSNNNRQNQKKEVDNNNFFMFIEKSKKCATESSDNKLSCQKT